MRARHRRQERLLVRPFYHYCKPIFDQSLVTTNQNNKHKRLTGNPDMQSRSQEKQLKKKRDHLNSRVIVLPVLHCFLSWRGTSLANHLCVYFLSSSGVIPYLPYSKQSKMRNRGSIPSKLVADLLCGAGKQTLSLTKYEYQSLAQNSNSKSNLIITISGVARILVRGRP